MKALGPGISALSALALVACGSSSNTAPVVYGTPPSSTARIYNSPADVYAQPAATAPVYQEPLPGLTAAQPIYVAQSGASNYVQVQPGDTVYAIARRFGVSPQGIIAENRLSPPYALAIGQTLRLPAAAPAQQAGYAQQQAAPPRRIVARDALYTVRPGDTLYSISRANGVSVQAVAQANRLYAPYDLKTGRQLLIPGARTAVAPAQNPQAPSSVEDLARSASYNAPTTQRSSLFDWPVKGAVIAGYGAGTPGRRNDGVNIAAPAGAPVRAAADGEVVYRGSELDGYGNLLLVKHDGGFVTAYAHNDAMLVRKGQKVRRGQVIAKVGQSGAVGEPQLHFEIRQNLKPVDPLGYLGAQ